MFTCRPVGGGCFDEEYFDSFSSSYSWHEGRWRSHAESTSSGDNLDIAVGRRIVSLTAFRTFYPIVEWSADCPHTIPEPRGGNRLINRQDLFQENRGHCRGQMGGPFDLEVFEFRTYMQRYHQSKWAKRFPSLALIALTHAQLGTINGHFSS